MPISPIGRTISPVGQGSWGYGTGLGNSSRTGLAGGASGISGPTNTGAVSPLGSADGSGQSRQAVESRFVQALSQAINDVDGLQRTADDEALSLLANGQTELHQAVIATEKAQLALQFALQVRNKVIEAYQEVMRMQV